MQCPKCGSENCQRLEVMYELGTQDINTVSRSAAIGSVAGRGAAGIGSTTTEGQSQTRMAEKASPLMTRKSFDFRKNAYRTTTCSHRMLCVLD